MNLLVASCSNLWPEKCGCKWVFPVQTVLTAGTLSFTIMHITTEWLNLMIQNSSKNHPVITNHLFTVRLLMNFELNRMFLSYSKVSSFNVCY